MHTERLVIPAFPDSLQKRTLKQFQDGYSGILRMKSPMGSYVYGSGYSQFDQVMQRFYTSGKITN